MSKPSPLTLCGHQLPWVQSAIHLGHELHESGLMDHDAVVKRANFIDKSVEVRNMFDWAAPAEVLQALKYYCSAFYGSMLWDLGGDKASQMYSAWDTAVKLAWSCPRWTRTFLLQQVLASGMTSARTDILGRYGKFFKGKCLPGSQGSVQHGCQRSPEHNCQEHQSTQEDFDGWAKQAEGSPAQESSCRHPCLEDGVPQVPTQAAAGGQAHSAGGQVDLHTRSY